MVAIRGFEIPKKCIWDCPFCNGEGGACELADIKTSDINRPLDCPLKEVHKADNEARLKAYTVAMLTEIKKEIDEMQCLYVDFAHYVNEYDVSNLIQQKINELEGESEVEDGNDD